MATVNEPVSKRLKTNQTEALVSHEGLKMNSRALVALSCVLVLLTTMLCPEAARAQADQSLAPRLVLLIVADQFSYNYLSRYQKKLSRGGLRYLMENGAHFTGCQLGCATTHAAVGHSVISTGAYPWKTGIVSNQWYNRRKRQLRDATSDSSARLIGANGVGGSTKSMQGTTLGDQLKLSTNGRAKVYSASVDRASSLLLAGRLATNAFWMDEKTGNMVASSKYGSMLPGWVTAFNDQRNANRYIGKPWQRLMPATQYAASTRDDYPRERAMPGDGRQFPHVINNYSLLTMTPWANQMVLDFAREAVDKERLGTHTSTDMLMLGLTAGEKLTQYFGPYSQETEDLVLRMDRSLESFFQFLDEKVGLSNCLIVFTASHGSPAIPEFLTQRGLEAGRVDPRVFATYIDAKLDERAGEEDWIESFSPPNLYLNLDAIDKQRLRQPEVETLVEREARRVPGIGPIVTAFQLLANQLPSSPYNDKIKKSYYFGRSGELYIAPEAGYVFISESTGTGYGSPYSYDAHVPLLMCGAGIKSGKFADTVTLADIAPTLAAVLEIEAPSLCEGSAIKRVISQADGPPRPRVAPPPAVQPKSDEKNKKRR